jgi:hypothetical protein
MHVPYRRQGMKTMKTPNRFQDLLREVGVHPSSPEHNEEHSSMTVCIVGKRSNPSYKQISTYVPADLYREVKKRLVAEERTLSEVTENLLRSWVKTEQKDTRG